VSDTWGVMGSRLLANSIALALSIGLFQLIFVPPLEASRVEKFGSVIAAVGAGFILVYVIILLFQLIVARRTHWQMLFLEGDDGEVDAVAMCRKSYYFIPGP
jgi:divalent metal cation (Fe/Co/Zn/Cd) transporter